MKCPKYIDKIIDRRARLAVELNDADCRLAEWLEKNMVEVDDYDVYGGCEMYMNPYNSAERIREAIKKAGEQR